MRIAILGDIHANLPALEAVLDHAHEQGVEAIWNLGDFVGYGPFPDQVVRRMREEGAIGVIGGDDLKTLAFKKKQKKWRHKKTLDEFLVYQWAYQNLSKPSRKYLKKLSQKAWLRIGELDILLTHGSPASAKESLTSDTPDKRLAKLASSAGADVFVCGCSHQPFSRQVKNTLFINPGSVGLSADGDPRACYAILELDPVLMQVGTDPDLDLSVHHHRVDYDLEKAIDEIRRRDLPEAYAQMLLQGRSLEQVKRHPEAWQAPEPDPDDSSWLGVPLLKHLARNDGDDDQVLSAVRKLSEVYTYSVDHIQHTTELVLTLFDELAPLHRLGPRERFWLRCAALLHDIGKPQGNKGHHKAARDIILETPHLPFEAPERKIIASIARYHRRAWPKDKHDLFSSLSPVHQRAVIILASILRVGDGLDSPHRGNVESVSCQFSPTEITIKCMVKKKAKKERKRALQKGKLLEFAFERKLFIQWHRA